MNRFIPKIDKDKLKEIQLKGLKWTVHHVYNNSHFYRRRFKENNITPDDIKTLDDIHKLPFVTAEDLKDGYPWPLISVPFEKIVRIHASSGTTGKRKVMVYTQKDIDDWANMFARVYELAGLSHEDRVQISVGYGVWTAGVGFQYGCERFGAIAIPIGPGNIDMQCQFLVDFQSTVICCTSSMALLLGEEIIKRDLQNKIAIRKIIMGSERASDAMIKRIKEAFSTDEVYDIPGLTEVYGPGTGLDCKYHSGIHYWADYFILEFLDPETHEPVDEGEIGEMVYTTLRKEGAPLVRYRSHDLTHVIEGMCECGCTFPKHDRILGRIDDMFQIRGVNVYPSHIDEILSQYDEYLGSEYQIHLTRSEGKDYMTINVERKNEKVDDKYINSIRKKIENEIKNRLLVSAKVEILPPYTLPRSTKKSRRVYDHRE